MLIVFAAMFGCDRGNEPTRKAALIVTFGMGNALIYEFEDRGCLFLSSYKGGLIHHPTCSNPNHTKP